MEIDRRSRGLIVAPAGYGKTHLIVSRIRGAEADERLLVLTHTNVAVRALRKRLKEKPTANVRIETIDSLALRIATSFPATSGSRKARGRDYDWESVVRPGALLALQTPAIRKAFMGSYSGVVVDEFQDCTRAQTALIGALAECLPTVVLGDPMQSVYQFKAAETLDWPTRTAGHPTLGSLDVPWRWQANAALGDWIHASRTALLGGQPIAIGGATAAQVRDLPKPADQAGLHCILQQLKGSTAVISGCSANPSRLSDVARGNKWDRCEVFETAAPDELKILATAHSVGTGADQALAVLVFAKKCMSSVGEVQGVRTCEKYLRDSQTVWRSGAPFAVALRGFLDRPTGTTAKAALECLRNDPKTYTYRPTLLRLAYRTYDYIGIGSPHNFDGALSAVLEARKHVDETAFGPSVGTSLRLKGLEFDNVVIVDPDAFTSIEQLYVAISRPANRIIFAVEKGQELGAHICRH